MVQEYKNTDLDLFQKIDLTNPKDELLKKTVVDDQSNQPLRGASLPPAGSIPKRRPGHFASKPLNPLCKKVDFIQSLARVPHGPFSCKMLSKIDKTHFHLVLALAVAGADAAANAAGKLAPPVVDELLPIGYYSLNDNASLRMLL